ncbi:transcriptional repressor LexA [Hyphococcus lacteus]|uniref:LexA repressor n=1 Tax=Hyphococcus lacteus TaxID=3143536 RepID=A0ABV3Z6D4_9PROT
MLTKKQHELLLFINKRISESGVSPSFDEMKEALELRSKSGIHRLITALEERGFIRRLPHRARALEVLKLPDDMTAAAPPAPAQRGFKPAIVNSNFKPMRQIPQPTTRPARQSQPAAGSVDLPVLGRIAAGTPIDAIQHEVDRFSAPEAFLGGGEHYILEVDGESMINAGINDGDFAIIKRCSDAENGAIVVALVDDQEATLKRLRRKGASIALEAANPAFETRIYGPDRVAVQGKLVGIMRRYH